MTDRDRLLAHDYDGIEEYDNPLPGWWVWLFWATIAFSGLYAVYYHLGPGQSIHDQFAEEMRVAAEQQARAAAAAGTPTDEALKALQGNPKLMAAAREMFAARCAACHGPQAQGLIGPNLTDEYWLHGGKLTDIYNTISEGVPEKGMVRWKDQLSPAEIRAMAAFVGSLQGTNPPNPKPPQGTKASGEPAPGWSAKP